MINFLEDIDGITELANTTPENVEKLLNDHKDVIIVSTHDENDEPHIHILRHVNDFIYGNIIHPYYIDNITSMNEDYLGMYNSQNIATILKFLTDENDCDTKFYVCNSSDTDKAIYTAYNLSPDDADLKKYLQNLGTVADIDTVMEETQQWC